MGIGHELMIGFGNILIVVIYMVSFPLIIKCAVDLVKDMIKEFQNPEDD